MKYSPLASEILTSSIWAEDDKTRIVWITMLALKDKDGYVAAAIPGLANIARVSVEDCEKAIIKLESPDKYSRTPTEEGRRIRKVEGGWIVINHFKYRNSLSNNNEAALSRERMRKMRERNNTVTLRNNSVTTRNPVYVSISDSSLNSYSEDFNTFWKVYPRRQAKIKAMEAWEKLKKKKILPEIKVIIESLEKQKKSDNWFNDSGKYIPLPASWLNAGGWMNEPTEVPILSNLS